MNKLGVGRARVYALISDAVGRTSLPPNIAAIVVARDAGVGISRFASDEDLTMIRDAGRHHRDQSPDPAPAPAPASSSGGPASARRRALRASKAKQPSGNSVWVVYGRNEKLRKALFEFLLALGLRPIEWNSAIVATRKGTPHIGEVLDAGFGKAVATVVLFTPDDEAKLKIEFIKPSDPRSEGKLTGQPRPNVLFEAGMAFGSRPDKTIIVQIGKIRPFSDLAGRHLTHLTGSFESRHQLVVKLKSVGCPVDDNGNLWHTAGDFNITRQRR
jgi:hypothetical protein